MLQHAHATYDACITMVSEHAVSSTSTPMSTPMSTPTRPSDDVTDTRITTLHTWRDALHARIAHITPLNWDDVHDSKCTWHGRIHVDSSMMTSHDAQHTIASSHDDTQHAITSSHDDMLASLHNIMVALSPRTHDAKIWLRGVAAWTVTGTTSRACVASQYGAMMISMRVCHASTHVMHAFRELASDAAIVMTATLATPPSTATSTATSTSTSTSTPTRAAIERHTDGTYMMHVLSDEATQHDAMDAEMKDAKTRKRTRAKDSATSNAAFMSPPRRVTRSSVTPSPSPSRRVTRSTASDADSVTSSSPPSRRLTRSSASPPSSSTKHHGI